MDWPGTAVEKISPQRFKPPFCPNPDCPTNQPDGHPFRWNYIGYYTRKCDRRFIPRYDCRSCPRTFSQQTFATTYYLKRPKLLPIIAAGLLSCSAARQIARAIGCSHSTVNLQGNRLGRHALLLQSLALQNIVTVNEPIVYDHFETFAACQEMQLGVGTPVGADSWFVFGMDPVPHKLGNKMTVARKKRLEKMEKRWGGIPQGSYVESTRNALDLILPKVPEGETLRWISDGHKSYPRAIENHPERQRITHQVHVVPERGPKGSERSDQAVRRDRAMFPSDLLHKLMRHSGANHKRETIAFGRRSNMIVLRGFLLGIWRNFVKNRSERRPTGRGPAVDLGLADRLWSWERVLAKRLFPFQETVPSGWMKLYRQEMETPGVGRNIRHELLYAF